MSAAAEPPLASVIVVSLDDCDNLRTCLPALARQTYQPREVIVVDNGSRDGGPEMVQADFPDVRLVRTGANLGYGGAANRGFKVAGGEVLVVLNADTEAHEGWLEGLVAALERDPDVALATSRVCHFDRRQVVNTCGNVIHLSGMAFCRGLDDPASQHAQAQDVPAASGCAFAIRRSALERLGGFDPDFFMYAEDTDLSLRARLAGYRIRFVPESVVYHRYALRLGAWKFGLLERNRLVVLLKSLRWRTLAALLPALLLMEVLTWTFALLRGPAYLRAKLVAYSWLVRHLPGVLRRRAEVQALRRVGDAALLTQMTPPLPLRQVLGDHRLGPLLGWLPNLLLAANHRAAVRLAGS